MSAFTDQFSSLQFGHFGMVKLPSVTVTPEHKAVVGLSVDATNQAFLLALARAGYKQRESSIPIKQRKEYGDRIKRELATFEELGFTDYVLLVWLVISKARELGVFIDYGRGSCAGSAVFWLLGITGVDPIAKRLLFERFVSRVRSKKQVIDGVTYLQGDLIADADLNLGSGLDQIVEWLSALYPGAVSKIVTHGTLTGKALINDVYKAMEGVSNEEAMRISGMVEREFGVVDDIEDAYTKSADFKAWADKHPQTYGICCQLQHLIRQTGVHASGYVISPQPFDGFLPIQLSKDKEIISCYAMEDVCNFAVKLDLLGLTTNRIIKEVLDRTGEDLNAINLDSDPFIYDRFQDGKLLPYGLYQIEGDCAYGVVQSIKPRNVFELSDVNAIARPGALAYLRPYIGNTHPCPHPVFEEILKPTRNLCLYQEQMMHMAVAVGFSLDEAEILRKIVGKKLVEKVKEWKAKVYERVAQSKLPANLADILWKILEDSASYSFNASHSLATSYTTALTVYLKYKHPKAFMCACLNVTKTLEERSNIAREMGRLGIKLLPADIIRSKSAFTIEEDGIRYGLESVKGVKTYAEKLASFRGDFQTKWEVFEALKAAKIPINVVGGLIHAGCLDSAIHDGSSRSKFALEAALYNLLTGKNEKTYVKRYGDEYQGDLIALIKGIAEKRDEKGKPLIKESRLGTLRRDYASHWSDYQSRAKNERLTEYLSERAYLGFGYSGTLHGIFSERVVGLVPLKDIVRFKGTRETFKVVAFVEEGKTKISAKGAPYWRATVFDDEASTRIMIHGEERIEACRSYNGDLPAAGDIVTITGQLSEDGALLFADSAIVQLSPLKPRKPDDPAI